MIRRFLPALLLLTSLAVAVHAQDVDLTPGELVTRGREHASADRHDAAVADFLRAVELDRSLLPAVARDLAYQTLWREDAETAVGHFRTWLDLNPDADQREVRAGLALALSWSGRQGEATAIYRDLVAADPTDGAARLGLARTLVWDQRLRAGWRELRAVERDFPADSTPRREADRLALGTLNDGTVPLDLRLDLSSDSDDLDVLRLGAHVARHLGGSFLLELEPSRAFYSQEGRPDIDAWRLKAGIAGALARNVGLHAYVWQDRFRADEPDTYLLGAPTADWDPVGADAWLTWLPRPDLRLDAGIGHQPVEAMSPLARQVRLDHRSLSGDWRMHRRWTVSASAGHADYTDGNRRWSWTGRLQWRREGRLEIWAGPTATVLDFARTGEGYWSPDRMSNLSLEARLRTSARSWLAEISGRLGLEKETGAETISVGGVGVRLGWRARPDALLVLEGGHARSRVTGSGYSRDFAAVSLRLFP